MLDAINTADTVDKDAAEWRKTTSNALFNYLFEACNILRGPINQDSYKTYVIPLLFFKRMRYILMIPRCRLSAPSPSYISVKKRI